MAESTITHPYHLCDKWFECGETEGPTIASGLEMSEQVEFVEKVFRTIAPGQIAASCAMVIFYIHFFQNDGLRTAARDDLPRYIAVEGLVDEDGLRIEACDQVRSGSVVIELIRRDNESLQPTKTVDDHLFF